MDIMKNRSRSFWVKLAALPAAITLLLVSVLAPAMASAWYDWDGMDPVIKIDGKELSISVYWPPALTCDVDDIIDIKVGVPNHRKAKLMSESSLTINGCTVTTATKLNNKGGNGNGPGGSNAEISVRLNSSVQFTVYVDVTWNGGPVQTISGPANSNVKGSVSLN